MGQLHAKYLSLSLSVCLCACVSQVLEMGQLHAKDLSPSVCLCVCVRVCLRFWRWVNYTLKIKIGAPGPIRGLYGTPIPFRSELVTKP
jgi:hypothetical protein